MQQDVCRLYANIIPFYIRKLTSKDFGFFKSPGTNLPWIPRDGQLDSHACFFLDHLTVSGRHLVPSSLSISLCYFLRNRDGFLDKEKIVFKSGVLIMAPQSSSQHIRVLSVVSVTFFSRGCCLFPSRTRVACDLQLPRLSVSLTGSTPSPFSGFLNLDDFEEVRLLL